MNLSEFKIVTRKVIDTLEGGYYHPNMLKDGRVKDSRYGNSGETMFGIDRKAGGDLNKTAAGVKFWNLIDDAGAAESWKWNYKGGNLGEQLKDLTAEIIYPEYERLSDLFLSDKSRAIVEKDNRLLFHFIYGTWNGPGWFKKFANAINTQVANGVTNADKLTETALNSRLQSGNSLIKQGGGKISQIFETMPKKSNRKRNIIIVVVIVVVVIGGYFVWKYRKPIGSKLKSIFK